LNFFAFHTSIVPVVLLILMSWHFWRIRRSGGLVILRKPEEDPAAKGEKMRAHPHLFLRELVVGLATIAAILLISTLVDAPLGAKANPGLSPNPTKAPWYFAGIQELLMHFHPLFAVFILPLGVLCGLLILPMLNSEHSASGIWFVSMKARRMAAMAALSALVMTPCMIILDELMTDDSQTTSGLLPTLAAGLIPAVLIAAVIVGCYALVRRFFQASRSEAIQAVFTFLLTAFLIMTITGIWFRGEGMALVWPWQR
jgi:quinol-cytochrome oxidoreductase complex cytochrome b subunit